MVPHETTFLEAFKESPLPFLLIVLLGFAGLALGVAALALAMTRGSRAVAVVAVMVGVLPVLVGLGGWALARSRVEAVMGVPGLTENDRRRIREAGEEEAGIVARTGVFGGVPGMALGVLGLVLGGKKKQQRG